MNQPIPVRDLLYVHHEMFPPQETFDVVFEDSITITVKRNKLVYSSFFWEVIKAYPNTPLVSHYYVDSVLKNKPLTADTHISLLQLLYEDVINLYKLHKPIEKEHLLGLVYDITNNIDDEVTKLAEPYVSTIDSLDFIEVTNYDKIRSMRQGVNNEMSTIVRYYEETTRILYKEPELDNNSLVIAVRAGLVNVNQVLQCVSVIGRVTEVDGFRLPNAILTNFTQGLNTIYEYAAASRSAAKSLYFSDAKLQDTEYTARRIQLLTMVVEKIDYFDCGTQQYLNWRVTPPSHDERGQVAYPGDLVFMEGKYYLDESCNELREIMGDDPSLHGRILKIRSVVYCQHPDPHRVCEVCFGALSKNISRHANLGHICAASMTRIMTQSVLSVKHIDFNVSGSEIVLNEVSRRYFDTNPQKTAYYLREQMKELNLRIVINRDEAAGLVDILNVDDMANITPIRMTSITCADMVHDNPATHEEESMVIFLAQSNKPVIMTFQFLMYLKHHRWETDNKNNFVFDMEGWDYMQPIFELPEMEYSYSDHAAMIARVIESNMKNITSRSKSHSVVSTLEELFSLVNTKIKVNIAALEVIIYSIMVVDQEHYGLARNAADPVLGIAALAIKNRSLGTAYTYEDIYKTMTNPMSFFKMDRPDSLFDVALHPKEYLEHHHYDINPSTTC